jgi:hypothetical protein
MAKTKKKKSEKKAGGKARSLVNVDASFGNLKDKFEVFQVEKGEEKRDIVQSLRQEREEPVSKAQIKKENRTLKKIIILMIGCVIFFATVYLIAYFSKNIEYHGVRFEIDKDTLRGKTLYRTTVPVIYNDSKAMYNFYLRTDPRKTETVVSVYGDIDFRQNMVLDVTTEELFCDGDWNIAIGNLLKLDIFGINITARNESQIYKPEKDFMFMTINKENKTEIKQIDAVHYEMNVANCEILPATERLMMEAFVKYKKVEKGSRS